MCDSYLVTCYLLLFKFYFITFILLPNNHNRCYIHNCYICMLVLVNLVKVDMML